MKKIIISAAVAALAFGATAHAQTAETENMYLIKDNRVVGKYPVNAVDYVSFKLPDDVQESNLWLNIDNVGKNTISYTVNTLDANIAYAHGIVSYYDANYMAMDQEGDYIDNLDPEQQETIIKSVLPYVAYAGAGTQNYTMNDWMVDGSGYHINVTPGTKYYVCAWEIDPVTQKPFDTFVYTEVNTDKPGQSNATLNVSFLRQNAEGLAFDISGSDDIMYISTAFGDKSTMEAYVEYFGADFLFGTFGQVYTIDFLKGMSETNPDIENATWPAYESGEYVLMVRGYDANGDMVAQNAVAVYEAGEPEGPQISIFSKSKGDGKVSVNFEISPNKVSEAYVRMLTENEVDDKLNDGYYLYEIASGGNAIDIESQINRDGEYTFKADGIGEGWYTLLIYARDMDGNRSTMRINFSMQEGSYWDIQDPVHSPKRNGAKAKIAAKRHRPTLDKVK